MTLPTIQKRLHIEPQFSRYSNTYNPSDIICLPTGFDITQQAAATATIVLHIQLPGKTILSTQVMTHTLPMPIIAAARVADHTVWQTQLPAEASKPKAIYWISVQTSHIQFYTRTIQLQEDPVILRSRSISPPDYTLNSQHADPFEPPPTYRKTASWISRSWRRRQLADLQSQSDRPKTLRLNKLLKFNAQATTKASMLVSTRTPLMYF